MKFPQIFYCLTIFGWSLNVQSVDEPQIVIIGAGASGIAAASKLLENGFNNVTILEAEDRIGGRILTMKLGDYLVDLGGQWVHGDEANPVYNIASPIKLLEQSINSFEFVTSSGEKPLSDEQTSNITSYYYEVLNSIKEYDVKKKVDRIGNIFRRTFKIYLSSHPEVANYEHQLLHWFELLILWIEGSSSWNDIAWTKRRRYSEDNLFNWKDKGYSMILDILMKQYPNPSEGLPIIEKTKLSTEVTKIDYIDVLEKVKIHVQSGENFEADHVIFTPSLGVLKSTHKTLFDPQLSQHKKHFIENFGYGSITKIYLLFEDAWWNTNNFSTNILWTDEDKKIRENDIDKKWQLFIAKIIKVEHKPKLLCILVVGKGAKDVESIPENKILPQINELLQIFQKSYNVTSPIKIIRSQWFANRHFRGAYSYNSFNTLRNHVNISSFIEPIYHDKPIILFAGEATDSNLYSSVDGAIAAGWREADRLIKLYRNNISIS